MQKMKRGRGFAPAYTSSVLANDKRIVVAHTVDPTNETVVVPQMLDQAMSHTDGNNKVKTLLVDGNYCNETVITATQERDIALLCPTGDASKQPKPGKRYQKVHFIYDKETNTYTCPAGQVLTLRYAPKDSAADKAKWVYGGAACHTCLRKDQCTKNKTQGRRIIRFRIDDMKDELRVVMQQPASKEAFKQRKAMVEPVFGHLRTVQGLNRFRRRGLAAVQLEFSLHLLAYNLSRAAALSLKAFFVHFWCVLWCFSCLQNELSRQNSPSIEAPCPASC